MMKRFKFGLVGIILGLFGFISFSSAGSVTYTGQLSFTNFGDSDNNYLFYFGIPNTTNSLNTPVYIDCYFYNISNLNSDFLVKPQGYSYKGNSVSRYYPVTADPTNVKANNYHYTLEQKDFVTFGLVNKVAGFTNSFDYSCTFSGAYIHGSSCPECQECETCPEVNTGDILSGSCDTNYCVENDLCPVASNFSQLFINDIEHQSAPLINITIPYEYSWDSSVNSGQFDLVISGQNVDYEYIDNIVRTQNSKPTTEDFNNIITGLIPLFIPGLVIILFIWFVFKFIKKIF